MNLRTRLATPEGKRQYVGRLFATIADRYDLATVLLSYGMDRRWKRRLARMATVRPGEQALDLACGTGDLAFEVAARGARVVGLDITARMIELADGRATGSSSRPATFLVGDMMRLPFADASFDLVTIGYGLRNAPLLEPALLEVRRVLRPGGRVLSLDFDRPDQPVIRSLYLGYLSLVGGALGWMLHRDPDTYRYIPESLRRYPGAAGVTVLMRRLGFEPTGYTVVLGGLMAINTGTRSTAA